MKHARKVSSRLKPQKQGNKKAVAAEHLQHHAEHLCEAEHGIVLCGVAGHDWSLLTRKTCIHYGVWHSRNAFNALVRAQQALAKDPDAALPSALLILDGFEPCYITDWCLQFGVTLHDLRVLNIALFFTGIVSAETDVYSYLAKNKMRLFIKRTASRRSVRVIRKPVRF